MSAVRTDQRRWFQVLWDQEGFLRLLRFFWKLGKQRPGLREIGGTIPVGEDAEMPDFYEAQSQNVQTEAAEKFLA